MDVEPTIPTISRKKFLEELPTVAEINAIFKLKGDDRTIEILSAACSNKAHILVAQGHVEIPECCGSFCCVVDHVARIHLERRELTQEEVAQISAGLHRHQDCIVESCKCHPEYGNAHHPCIDDLDLASLHYIPNPTSGD